MRRTCRSRDWKRVARSILLETVACGGVFHLWGHSWELDGTGQWDRLDDMMRLMSEYSSQAPALTNGELAEHARRHAAAGSEGDRLTANGDRPRTAKP